VRTLTCRDPIWFGVRFSALERARVKRSSLERRQGNVAAEISRPITPHTLGAWVLKCDPEVWDLGRFVDDGSARILTWSVRQSYRTELMAPGQRVLLWVSGESRRHPRGFWGSGWVTGKVSTGVEDDGYWLDDERRRAVRHWAHVDVAVFGGPQAVLASEVREHPVLRDFELFRSAQMSNPSWLSREQLAALTPMLPAWPDYPGPMDDIVVVGEWSATRDDAATRLAVESAAMIAVEEHYERQGGSWKDVSARCLGYDLACTASDGSVHHVEVKGLSGGRRDFLLTRNEHQVAGTDPAWRLAVVTRALEPTHRRLTIEPAATVLERARPYVYSVDLDRDA
jgi:hypothetical protein